MREQNVKINHKGKVEKGEKKGEEKEREGRINNAPFPSK